MSIEDAWAELDAFLTGEDMLPAPTGEVDQITLSGEIDATRAGRALARLRRDEDELAAVLAAERDRIAAFEADRRAGIDRARARLLGGLEAFMREEAARRGVTQLKLPTVTISLRKNPDRIDGHVDAGYAETRPEIVRVKPVQYELDKAAARQVLAAGPLVETGEDGVERRQAVAADGAEVVGVYFLVPTVKEFRWELRAESEAEPGEVES